MRIDLRLVRYEVKIRITDEIKKNTDILKIDGTNGIVNNDVSIETNQITVAPCSLGRIFTVNLYLFYHKSFDIPLTNITVKN